jgi:arginine/lysine/ornithine decarboxylase
MFTPSIGREALEHVIQLLTSVKKRSPITERPPRLALPIRRMRPHDALFSLQETLPVEDALGRVLASASVTCPPAVPVVVCGEEIDETAIACFRYYGIEKCFVVKE